MSKPQLSPPPKSSICKALSISQVNVTWLAGDGSDRAYYRLSSPDLENTLVLMQLSGEDILRLRENKYDWLEISELLQLNGIRAPCPIAKVDEFGALIIEDYGDVMLETLAIQAPNNDEARKKTDLLYSQSLDVLIKMLLIPKPAGPSAWTTKRFDLDRYQWEIGFFRKKYLEGVLDLSLTSDQWRRFEEDSFNLSEFLGLSADFFVHRDFHSRNIMVKGQNTAVIDFQDARLGPATYDMVSLFFDSYTPQDVSWRLGQVDSFLKAVKLKFTSSVYERCKDEWKAMLLQRQLKAVGSFGYLTLDKGKGDYLKYVPKAIDLLIKTNVFDARWSFISGEFLTLLASKLPSSTSAS